MTKEPLIETLKDVLSIIQQDGEYCYGETPEDESYITFESSTINAIEADIKTILAETKNSFFDSTTA